MARAGRIPLGYFDDADATQKTFPEVGGQRVVIAGDRGLLAPDGTLRLLGRDSLVVNTGGEKVFVEEVEEVLRAHPDIADALVVGRPSEQWGSEVVAIVQLADGATASDQDLLDEAIKHIARYKLPKAFVYRSALVRSPAGKADYRWARDQAIEG